ncbi:MAG: exodeoxyribonuclease III, partial [Pseudomonadota bacterium]
MRIKLLANLVAKAQPDIICLQETKVADQQFPLSQAQQIMPYAYYLGNPLQSGYNGVAILSKMPLDLIPPVYWYGKNDARFIGARLPNGTEIHNFYVPAGGDEPDPKINAKYAHKLQFAEEMTNWYQQNYQPDHKIIMLGDLNIAPQEHDVWSHKQLLKVVSHTEPEVSRMKQLQQTLNWCDVGRHFTPAEQKLYSWWSYR